MMEGLEEVVEGILPEIALSGENGASIADFLALIKAYSNGANSAAVALPPVAVTQASLSDAEMSFARTAWTWLVSRSEVLVGGDKRWNRLGLDEILALPESQPTEYESTAAGPADNQPRRDGPLLAPGTPLKEGKESRRTLEIQPRIYVTEETIWKRLTRHGVDHKRIPNLEWKCLLGIASAKREGILQVDLRRLVNQDKRSVPKRTDFLAAKGYIVKRSLFALGTKTSKLWLTDLAPAMFPKADGDALARGANMSKAALTKDTSPVLWHKRWTGKDIDVEAFAETLIVIVKAWGVMRYSDLRSKMGVEELKWQMRTMSRVCRNLVDMGILRYAAATFINSRKIWKDCIKFIRDPSEEEWAKVLATGKKTSILANPAKDQQPRPSIASVNDKPAGPLALAEENDNQEAEDVSPAQSMPFGWVPEKPVVHTLFDAVQGAGPGGVSNPNISAVTIGHNFRRYVGSTLSNSANNRQPAHLRRFQIGSKLVRHGKTATYMYSAKHAVNSPSEADTAQAEIPVQTGNGDNLLDLSVSSPLALSYGFGAIRPRNLDEETSTLSALSQTAARKGHTKPPRQRKVHSPGPRLGEDTVANISAPASGTSSSPFVVGEEGRPLKRRCIETGAGPELGDLPGAATLATQGDGCSKMAEKMPGKPPGVYIGKPGSLSPPRRGQGRPRKSLVVIFKSEKLKSPRFLESQAAPSAVTKSAEAPPTDPEIPPLPTQQSTDSSRPNDGPGRPRKTRAVGSGGKPFKCDKCGGAWKNDVGLKYHLTKAQTPCNPNFTLPVADGRGKRRMPVPASGEQPRGSDKGKNLVRRHRSKADNHKHRTARRAPRIVRGATPTFRGLAIDDNPPRGTFPEPIVPKETHRNEAPSSFSPVKTPGTEFLARRPQAVNPQASDAVSTRLDSLAQPCEQMEIDSRDMGFTNNIEAMGRNTRGEPHPPNSHPGALDESTKGPARPELHAELNTASTHVSPPTAVEASTAPTGLSSLPRGQEPGNHVSEKAGNTASAIQKLRPQIPGTVTPIEQQTTHGQQPPSFTELKDVPSTEDEARLPTPFQSSTDYRRMFTESKIKTAQALEIIEYLLDNNGGVFPGDKALFYAVIRVFLKAFHGQSPPTFNNYKVALRNLDTKKKAREIVNAFRDSDGKLVVSTMLVRTGLDPSSIVPAMLKRKIQDAHPNVFIPAAFSPSKEELRMLQELDREPPESERSAKHRSFFRTRRDQAGDQAGDLEILDAPYYSQSLALNKMPGADGQKRPGLQTLKRRRESDANDLMEGSNEKKAKTETTAAQLDQVLMGPTGHHLESHIAKYPITNDSQHGSTAYMSHHDPMNMESTSVAAAITFFDLLPAKRGSRKNQKTSAAKTARKLPRMNRLNNPGLDSLPAGFLTNRGSSLQPHTPYLQFLEPNMHLETPQEFGSEDDESPQTPDTSSIATGQEPSPVGRPDTTKREGVVFVPSVVLKENTRGVWPALTAQYFTEQAGNASFVLDGWVPDRDLLLFEHIPVSVDDIIARSKRLVGGPSTWADPLLEVFCQDAERIKSWELSEEGTAVLSAGMPTLNHNYINLSATAARANMAPVMPVWSAKNMFDLETLPYGDLEDDTPEKDGIPTQKPGSRRRRDFADTQLLYSPRKSANQGRGRKPDKSLRVVPLSWSRQHTAYPKSADEFIVVDDSNEAKEDWYSESTRLAAFVCVTTLVGGVGRSVDWGLLLRLFPNMALSTLRRFWTDARKDRMSSIVNLTTRFRKEFLKAYENNEVPPIDYDNILAYDWKFLILWTRKLLAADTGSIYLPATSKELDDQNLVTANPTYKARDWRETYFFPVRSYFDRFQDASSQAISIPVDKIKEPAGDGLVVAMSWIRALYVTPPFRYSAQVLQQRLNLLFGLPPAERTKLIEDASSMLRDQIMIARSSRRGADGRPWKLSGRVVKVLDKAAQEEKYAKAVEFKKELDACFRQGEKALVKYVCNDGMIMAILNLHAHKRIDIETTGQPNVPMGYEPFNYETRKYPKKYHHFKMHLSPTESYLYDDDDELTELRDRIAAAEPPLWGPRGEIPLWRDIFGQLDVARWYKCMGAVLFILSTRAATGANALANALKPSMMAFEAQMILDWAGRLDLLRPQVEGTAPAPTEWWWQAVDAQRMREAPSGPGIGEGRVSAPVGAGATAPGIGNTAVRGISHAPGPAVTGGADDDAMDVDGQ